ncbi:putative Ig domain-containing protein [Labedaea rhizosphaerae]|uniref:putative Ig domain-containing protein n=1 Tax=Labedaea rhizosphaerae TaxID=598644 RepID=UPI001414DF85|nr:putative Ig domain-containing protein [Labedaea rhizosphaerae]
MTGAALLAAGLGVAVGQAPVASAATVPQLVPASCATAPAGHAKCQAIQLVPGTSAAPATAVSPTDLQKAYGVTGLKSNGATVAVVDAFHDPNIERDLGDYRSHWGLPPCTKANGCLKVVGQDGSSNLPTQTDSGWATEMTIDVDAVSAVCPDCHILLVEGNTNDDTDLGEAVDSAVRLGAKFVSNSYADHESSIPSDSETHYNHPGVMIAAATGDNGTESGSSTEYPASSPEVVAVGGTTLTPSSNSRGFTETAWNKGGSGCSSKFGKPSYQNVTTSCSKRATSDISAEGDPNTGIVIYQNGATSQWGGTSLATPIVAGIWALAGAPNSGDNAASYPYAHPGNFNDITSGSNGGCGTVVCNAGTGWDGPTGLGTPNGTAGLLPGGGNGSVTVQNPGDQSSTVGQAVNLKITASGGTSPYTFSAKGLPAGLSIDSSSGAISGTPTTAGGPTAVTVTATDSAGKSGTATFNWTVTAVGQPAITNPGNQTGTVGQAVNLPIKATGGTTPYSFSASGLPAGLSIDSSSGTISGTPTTAGQSATTVTVTDANGKTAQASFTWTINPASTSTLKAAFTLDYDYGWGAFGHVTITNTGSTAVTGWKVTFDIPTSEYLWTVNPGTIVSNTGHVVVTGTGTIPAGGTLSVQTTFQVNSGSFVTPANVAATNR